MSDEEGTYGGLVGAFPYAFRHSDSRTFRAYAVVGGLLGAGTALLLLLALPGWIAATLRQSATATLSRAFLVVVWLFVFAPLVAPVLLVARRHRREGGAAPGYEALLGATGFLFVAGLYLGLLVAVPAGSRGTPPAAVAPVVEFLYGLPRAAAVGPPLAAVAAMALVHWRRGR